MSQNQAEAAVDETANKMFGRNWKYHDGAEIDVDTLPDKKNARGVGKCIEAMALSEIVIKVVSSDEKSTMTYANDDSKKQGASSFTVQGIIINGKYIQTTKINYQSSVGRSILQAPHFRRSILLSGGGY